MTEISSCHRKRNYFYQQNYGWVGGRSKAKRIRVVFGGGTTNLNNPSSSQNAVPEAKAGLLTGGETNDLGKWLLWNDLVKENLAAQIELWNMHPYHRYAVQLQTNTNMPVQGANVKLINTKNEILWQSVTDNTGKAQLWQGIFNETKDTSILEIQIEYKGIKEKISQPIDYFKGINTKTIITSYERPEIVDIAFMVDATASMDDEIDFLKVELNDIIKKTIGNYPEIDLRLGALFYRCKDNSYTTKHKALTKDHNEIIEFINEQDADEGGMEAVEVAFDVALQNLSWHQEARTRLLFVVLDEPSGYTKEIIDKLHEQIMLAAKKGIKIIPVVASGGSGQFDMRNLEYFMRSTAVATNGNYIFITDHSGIGNSHTEPIIDNYEVELLNDIICKTIENNIYMPEIKPASEENKRDTLLIDNKKEIVNRYLDSLNNSLEDSAFIATILPYTDCSSEKEMKEKLPVEKIDTVKFINEIKEEIHTLKIYPNPTNGSLKAEFNTKIEWLYVADLSGKIVLRIPTNKTQVVSIDLIAFPNGIYMIQYPDKEKWISAKIVLQK